MNNQEFRGEMHRYLDEKYDRFQQVQQDVTRVFQAFHKVCKDNNIPYYVIYGTLMGLVRDGGLIPWDSDMDVAVSIDDRQKLKEVLKRDLPEEFYTVCEDQEDFDYFQLRVCKKGTHHDCLHLDVFYMIGAPEGHKLEKFKTQVANAFRKRIVYRYYLGMKDRKDLGRMEKLTKAFYGLKVGRLTIDRLNAEMEALAYRYPYREAGQLITVVEERNAIKKELLEPAHYVQTPVGEASYPHDETRYLNAVYKNYREYPPMQFRFREFYNYIEVNDAVARQKPDYYIE